MAADIAKRNKRQYEWQKMNTDRINFTMPKGTKLDIKAAAMLCEIKPSDFIRSAIHEKIEAIRKKDPE